MKQPLVESVAIGLGALLLLNGLYMLIAPQAWYWAIPGVPERGSFNVHFVRDIGIIYALCGGALVFGAISVILWILASRGHCQFQFFMVHSNNIFLGIIKAIALGIYQNINFFGRKRNEPP